MTHEDYAIQNQTAIVHNQGRGYQHEETAIGNPATISELKSQVSIIQEAMKSVMKNDEHYGVIPGTSGKPSLLKPGAEKLSLLFRLAPSYKVTKSDLGNGHREYEVVCTLSHITTGNIMGEGVGSCNTMEGKYRYRTENTGDEVPAVYWDTRDRSVIGGNAYSAKKSAGKWYIFHRVDHDNPADYYNTVLKMAKKRAHVDAILTATAASDIFTQDVEDMTEVIAPEPVAQPTRQTAQPAPRQQPKPSNELPWLNKTAKGSTQVTDQWEDVENKIRAGMWGIEEVIQNYRLSRAIRSEIESIIMEAS